MAALGTRRVAALAAVALGAAAAVGGLGVGGAGAATGAGFASYSLGTSPAPAPGGPGGFGPTCPTAGSACTNTAAEPQIRVDSSGRFYASSENGLGAGTQAWRSFDGGQSFTALTSPNETAPALGAAGGDTDVAVAPEKNWGNVYSNVYVASLNLGSVYVSTSNDGGRTWVIHNPVAANQAGDDREWLAADEETHVCLSYHALSENDQIAVDCSVDAGKTWTVTAVPGAIDTNHAYDLGANEIGNLAFDTHEPAGKPHYLYQAFSGVDNTTESATCQTTGPCYYRDVFVAVSTNNGHSFTDYLVHRGSATTDYEHQFVNVSVDTAGNVYLVYSDNHNLYYSYSTDHGVRWSSPMQINRAPSATAVMPWANAGAAGRLDVVWYGSSFYRAGTTPDNYPASATWRVYFAQSMNATTGRAFSQVAATPVIHTGGVCEAGVSCTGNRDLYDDFGVAASPTTGLATIIYSDDQYNPSGPNSSGCTSSTTDTSSCDHTEIARQLSGGRLY